MKSSIRIRGANFSMLWLQRCCEKVATNNWLRPWSFKRSLKTEPDRQKNWCENSNLNLPTIKTVFTVIRILKIRYVSWNGSAHSFGIVGSYRSSGYAWIVIQRKTHGEPFLYVKSSIRIRGAIFSMLWLQRCCEKAATNNWVRPHSFKRSSKTEPDQQKF